MEDSYLFSHERSVYEAVIYMPFHNTLVPRHQDDLICVKSPEDSMSVNTSLGMLFLQSSLMFGGENCVALQRVSRANHCRGG